MEENCSITPVSSLSWHVILSVIKAQVCPALMSLFFAWQRHENYFDNDWIALYCESLKPKTDRTAGVSL